ncbi:STAS-like domain-containing protein [Candidatus Nomurabacteria bacterium]|jgi:hypothetical protein|nr:MAG: STAS-like domain-containing protein [Candidatus Nomurabacteria bacterium]
MDTVKIVFTEFGPDITMRFTGVSARGKIVDALNDSKKVVFCFTGVETISESFADECFAKLLTIFPLEFIKENTSYEDANPFIKEVIKKAFVERIQGESE